MNVTAANIAKSLTAIPVGVLLQFIHQPSAGGTRMLTHRP